MSDIRVEVPSTVDDKEISRYLLANAAFFLPALNRRAKDHDPRSEVDTFRITGVQVHSDQAVVLYEVDFCIRHGCQDRVDSDTHRRQVIARRVGRCFVFQSDSPAETRSTDDEF